MRCRAIPAVLAAALTTGGAAAQDAAWRRLEPGLDLARVTAPGTPRLGDGLVTVLRADLGRFKPVLVMARFEGGKNRTAAEWAREKSLVVATNAGLYQGDYSTSVGQMVDGRRVNNPKLNEYGMVLAFNPKAARAAPLAIIDRRCGGTSEPALAAYDTRVQNLRFLDCRGKPVWRGREQPWSMSVLALDGEGRALFVYTQSPHTASEFAALLARLPIGAKRAIYLEGGSPSQLYVDAPGARLDLGPLCGSRGCAPSPAEPRDIPNVIGLARR